MSSDYLLDALGFAPNSIHKRLGDGYYEQKLVREQIAQLTGRRFLDGYASDEEQYRGLMQSGAAFAQTYGLRPGVALSAAQMAQLTSDIVWLVEQTITLADGSTTTALVPQLYVRLQPGDLEPSGALLAGENINIKLSGDATNTGTIAGRKLVTLDADNIHNLQGAAISGAQVGLQARQDINITGSTVTASEALSAKAGGDITINSTLASFDGGNNAQTTIDRVAGLYVTAPEGQGALSVNAGNNLLLAAATIHNAGSGNTLLKAGNDLTLSTLSEQRSQSRGDIESGGNGYSESSTTFIGSTISGAGNVVLAAGNDINATAATVNAGNALAVVAGNNLTSRSATDSQRQSGRDVGKKHSRLYDTFDETVQGSSFTAGGDIAMQAGNDLTLQSASVISDQGAVNLAAGNNLTLTTTQEQHDLSTSSSSKKSGFLSSKKTSTADEVHDSIAIGSTISGNTVGLQAGNDMTITGSQVISDAGTALLAGGDILVNAGVNTRSERHDKTVSKSGLFSDDGIGFTLGKQSLGNEADITEVTHTGSVIGSVDGKVNVVAGGDVGIAGSDVIGNGGVNISGKNVLITHVDDTLSVEEQQKAKSSGLHISIKGGAADVATSAYQSAKRGSEVEDGRLSALYAAKTAQTLSNGAGSLANASAQASQAVTDAQNGTSTDGGMSLRIGIGGSSSTNTTGYEQTSAGGSSISSANGNINIVAREGDLSIIGSQVDGNNVALAAANDLLLQSASQGSDLSEKSKAQSGEIGITIGSEAGIGVYVSASAARGKGQGQGQSHAETTINSRGTTSFVSGNDTTLDGAQLSGERVIGLVGGDFTLTSQQDSNDYQRKDVAAGIDAAIGTGGGSVSGYASASKVDSTYTSVNQQTGIQAGSSGTQIEVGGHTQLDGAAIASTADPSNNFFSTGSLGYSDIYNEAEYKAQSASVSGAAR